MKIAKSFAEKPKNVPKLVNFCKKVTHFCNPDNVHCKNYAGHFEHEVRFFRICQMNFLKSKSAMYFLGSWVFGPVKTEISMIQSTFLGKLKS